jgi:Tol biopolymer transport system component
MRHQSKNLNTCLHCFHLQLYSVDVATGSDITRLTVSTNGRTGGMGGKPSPCGKYLAFASDRDLTMPAGLFDLYVMKLPDAKGRRPSDAHASGSGSRQPSPRRLTWGIANQFSRSWSPDSKQLVFNSQVRASECLIMAQGTLRQGTTPAALLCKKQRRGPYWGELPSAVVLCPRFQLMQRKAC